MRLRFLEGQRGALSVDRLYRVMNVSPRGLRAFRIRPANRRLHMDMVGLAHIKGQSRLSPGSLVNRTERRFDMQYQLRPMLGRIMSGEIDGASVGPSDFDLWLDDRFSGRPDRTWLAPHNISATAAFCRMFRTGLTPAEATPVAQHHAATSAGFEIVRHGPDAIKGRLIRLSFKGDGVANGIRQVYPRMLSTLDHHLHSFCRHRREGAERQPLPVAPPAGRGGSGCLR